jgi:hypothetical protein
LPLLVWCRFELVRHLPWIFLGGVKNTGKTSIARLMDFLRWNTFAQLVSRHDGDRRARALTCTEQFRAMTLAQLTYRERLSDIET